MPRDLDNVMVRSTSYTFSIVVPTTGILLVPANPRRVALLISAPQAGRITVTQEPTPVDLAGILLNAGQYPLQMSLRDMGDAVRKAWYAIAVGGTPLIGVMECVALDDVWE